MCVLLYCYDRFYSCDLDLNPMTLTYELDIDILKLYLRTKREIIRSRLSNITAPHELDR